jgi:photosystem II stability/assembly factor-like uncharacterized protein
VFVIAGLIGMGGTALAQVQVGSSGWLWGNPLPQGNTLVASSFSGATGYAVGDFGTLVATQDAAATSVGLNSGTFANLTEVQAIDGQALFAGGGCVGRRSDDGGKTFARVNFTNVETRCQKPLAAAWWVSRTTGYLALSDGTLLRTTNNGDSFSQQVAPPGTNAGGGPATVNDLVFTTPEAGVVATSDGKLQRTTNSGNTWTPVADNQRQVRKLLFFDAANGIAVGDRSLFLATDDGGASWKSRALTLGAAQDLRDVSCATPKLCIMATGTTQLVRTTDGGETGGLVAPAQNALNSASFAGATRIVAFGATGTTVVSDDAGATFSQVGSPLPGRYSAMIAGPQGVAFAPGENGALARTTDGGRSWRRGNVASSEDVIDVSFPTTADGFALDAAGGLFRTEDESATWRALDTGSTARPKAVLAASPAVVMVAGPRGIRRSTDAGDSFAAIRGAVNDSQLSDLDAAGTAIVASGIQDIWRSADQGRTWARVRKPGRSVRRNGRTVNLKTLRHVDFVSAKVGYVLDTKGTLYRTADGGSSWTTLTAVGTDSGYGMGFGSSTSGYLVISRFGDDVGGFLLRTSDAGRTWTPEFVVAQSINAEGVAAGPGGTDYLLGGSSSLLFTTRGGLTGDPSKLTIATKTARFRKPPKGTITVTGKLTPTKGADRVTVSYLPPGRTAWRTQTVKVAANGNYTTSWRLAKGTNTFVAQWSGNFQNSGRGTTPLVVKVGS